MSLFCGGHVRQASHRQSVRGLSAVTEGGALQQEVMGGGGKQRIIPRHAGFDMSSFSPPLPFLLPPPSSPLFPSSPGSTPRPAEDAEVWAVGSRCVFGFLPGSDGEIRHDVRRARWPDQDVVWGW